MGRTARIVVYGAVAVAVAFIGLTIAYLAVNARDEALSPEAARMLAVPQNPYAPQENLFVALAGMDAPPGGSIIAAGEQSIAASDRIAALRSRDRQAAYAEEAAKSDRLRPRSGFDCRPAHVSCWSGVDKRRAAHAADLAVNGESYRRYLQLHAMRGYFDAAKASPAGTPPMFVPPAARTLFIEDVALRVKDARTAQERSAALADLDRDIATWHAMLTGQGTLVSKFVAIFNLHGDYALLADIIGDPSVDLSPHLGEIETMLSRVTPQDWKITGALDYEFRVIAATFDDLEREQGSLLGERVPGEKAPWWQSLLAGDLSSYFRPNATKNLAARHMVELKRLMDADGRDFKAEKERLDRWRREHLAPGLAYFHNPLGRFLLSIAPESYDEYPMRTHDITGFQRLVRLAFEVRKQGIADDAIPVFITKHAWAAHPVNGEPFTWDAVKRELVMQPLAKPNKDRRFRVPVK